MNEGGEYRWVGGFIGEKGRKGYPYDEIGRESFQVGPQAPTKTLLKKDPAHVAPCFRRLLTAIGGPHGHPSRSPFVNVLPKRSAATRACRVPHGHRVRATTTPRLRTLDLEGITYSNPGFA